MSDLPAALATPEDVPENQISRYLDPTGPQFWCSVPLDTQEGKMLVYAAREGRAEQASKWINQEIAVSNLLLHPVALTRETGEVVDLIRAVMIQPDGQLLATCSSGIVSSLRTACQIFGRPPWNPPIRFRVVQLEIKGGRRLYKLEPSTIEVSAKKEKR